MTPRTLVYAVAVASSLAMMFVPSAQAAEGYEASVWHNSTPFSIGGRYRWGDEPWHDFHVESSRTFSTWHPNGNAKPLYIEFDADPGPGYNRQGYHLKTYFTQSTIFDHPTERFIVRNGNFVDMVNLQK
jgi:hypothetical protein